MTIQRSIMILLRQGENIIDSKRMGQNIFYWRHIGPLFVVYRELLSALSKNIVFHNSKVLEIPFPKCNKPITDPIPNSL